MADNLAYSLKQLSYSTILKGNIELSKSVNGKEFTVDVLSNVIINPIKEILEYYIRSLSLKPVIRFGNYDNIVQDTFVLAQGDMDMVIVFYELINLSENFHLSAELLADDEVSDHIEKCKRDIDLIFANLSVKPLVVFNTFSSYPFTGSNSAKRNLDFMERELNHYIHQNKPANTQFVDVGRILNAIGADVAYDRKKFQKYKSLYKIDFFKFYVSAIENILLKRTGKLKKALIFDCDNTLWKGVIGEDGTQGIDMSSKTEAGMNYYFVQKIAASLSQKGVLICLCSKNNLEDVEGLLGKHPDMILNSEHIVAMKINWQPKNENLKMLAEELNIGLDSFVFVDDSDFEVNLIKTSLPEVLTVAVPTDISEYPGMIMEIAQRYFNLEPLTEDTKKIKIYKEQAKRSEAMRQIGDIDSYLTTLETKVIISHNDASQISRIAQLTQKTNQFNLTTKRYSETEIEGFMKNPAFHVFTIDVSDKFGDSGITGVAILKQSDNPKVMEIDSYLLSCRILGRKIETFFLNFIISFFSRAQYKTIKSTYIKTNKNIQVKDFYVTHQFTEEQLNEGQSNYVLDMESYHETKIDFITLIEP
jgi:FkbH-like protein